MRELRHTGRFSWSTFAARYSLYLSMLRFNAQSQKSWLIACLVERITVRNVQGGKVASPQQGSRDGPASRLPARHVTPSNAAAHPPPLIPAHFHQLTVTSELLWTPSMMRTLDFSAPLPVCCQTCAHLSRRSYGNPPLDLKDSAASTVL